MSIISLISRQKDGRGKEGGGGGGGYSRLYVNYYGHISNKIVFPVEAEIR